MKLSLVERETILLYNQAEPMAEIYTHAYIVKLSVLHAGGFEDTIQDQRHDYGQYAFEEKCFDCFASCHR